MKPVKQVKRGDIIAARHQRNAAKGVNTLEHLTVGPGLELKKTSAGFALTLRNVPARGGAGEEPVTDEYWVLGHVQGEEDRDWWYDGVYCHEMGDDGGCVSPEYNAGFILSVITDVKYEHESGEADSYCLTYRVRQLKVDAGGRIRLVSIEQPLTLITEAKPCPP